MEGELWLVLVYRVYAVPMKEKRGHRMPWNWSYSSVMGVVSLFCVNICWVRLVEAGPHDDLGQVTDSENVNDWDLKAANQLPGSVSDCGLEVGPTKSVPMAEGKAEEGIQKAPANLLTDSGKSDVTGWRRIPALPVSSSRMNGTYGGIEKQKTVLLSEYRSARTVPTRKSSATRGAECFGGQLSKTPGMRGQL
ncbi:hypothetical protein STEG23_035813 [Scotinomys teguina]